MWVSWAYLWNYNVHLLDNFQSVDSPWNFGMGRTVGLWCLCWDMGVPRTSYSPKGTLGWERQWDCDVSAGTWESQGHLSVPLGLWDGKDSGTVMSLLGHGSPKDILQSKGDIGKGRTVGLWCLCWDMGVPRTSCSPKGTLGWEGQWNCDVSAVTQESKDIL